jgi:hypothetical protein
VRIPGRPLCPGIHEQEQLQNLQGIAECVIYAVSQIIAVEFGLLYNLVEPGNLQICRRHSDRREVCEKQPGWGSGRSVRLAGKLWFCMICIDEVSIE